MKKSGPISIIPFWIYNRKPFIDQDHPVINPVQPEYAVYWKKIIEKCLYGIWGHDHDGTNGGYRWMPGNLYFYINLTPIEKEGEDGSQILAPPTLRDIDWFKFYGMVTCDGFSGFEDDDEFTCYRPVGKLQEGLKLKHAELKRLDNESAYIKKKDGSYKTYVDAREYLYKTYSRPLGKPLWRNESTNWLELTSRGIGKSFTLANGEIAYDYVFNGCRSLKEVLRGVISTTIVVGSSVSKYTDDLLDKFSKTYEYLRTHHGYYNDGKTETPGVFWLPYEGQLSIDGKPFTNRTQKAGGKGYIGAGSKIFNVTYYNRSNAGIGKRARKFITDEAGTLDNFEKVHGFNSAAQRRETKFGKSTYSGTGGEMTEIVGIKKAFGSPKGYGILPYPDLFGFNNAETGLFVPVYYRLDIYRDPNGNLLINEAYEDELEEREFIKKHSPDQYAEHIISYPFWPHEMFMQAADNLFPTVELENRLNELLSGEWDKIAKPGWLNYIDEEKTQLKFDLDLTGSLEILNRYQAEKNTKNRKGGIVIYEMPIPDKPNPTYNDPLYITVYDPVALDKDGSSICSVIVFKFYQPDDLSKIQFNIVAEWHGRYDTLDENHEVAFKLAMFYGSKVLPEINNADILRNGRDTFRWYMFQPKPKGILGQFNQTREYEVGVLITPGMKGTLALYLNEIFNTVVDKLITVEDGKQVEIIVKMASKITSIRVCDEALQYGEGNFDAISAMFLVALLYRNSVMVPSGKKTEEEKEIIKSYKKFVKTKRIIYKHHPAFSK